MNIRTNDDIVEMILDFEGRGEAETVPGDRGGITKFGITKQTLVDVGRQDVTDDDIRNLTLDDARNIYNELYIKRPHYNGIVDLGLRAVVVDAAVNCGVSWSSKALQRACGASPVDGIVGPSTLTLTNLATPRLLRASLIQQRRAHYSAIVAADPTQQKFLAGWLARCSALEA